MTGEELIKKWEGLRLEAYLDGGGVPTIGYGHTKGVHLGQVITKEQAEIAFQEDYKDACIDLYKYVKVPLTKNQEGALICFIFNIGETQFASSTLLKLLNRGLYLEASNQFPRWNRDNGKIISGLTNRRLNEKQVFNTP